MLLRRWPDPVLSRPCAPFGDGDLEALARSMVRAMRRHDGVGLAANQVGVDAAVLVADDPGHPGVGELAGVLVLADPALVSASGAQDGAEGCLSLPGCEAHVMRPARVVVEGMGIDGHRVRVEAEGLLARILCHELDHLAGRVILDPAIVAREG